MILKKRGIIRSVIILLIAIPAWYFYVKGHSHSLRIVSGIIAGLTSLYILFFFLALPFLTTKGANERTRKQMVEKANKWWERANWHDKN